MGMFPDSKPIQSDYVDYDIGSENYISPVQKDLSSWQDSQLFGVVQVDGETDLLLHLDDSNCARYALASQMTDSSSEYKIVSDYFWSNYKSDLERVVNQTIKSPKEMNDICGYLQWAQIAGLDLKFEVPDKTNQYCLAFGDSKLYSVSYGLDELWKLSSFEFLQQLQYLNSALNLELAAPQLKKLILKNKKLPKFIHYAAHAETLSDFFEGTALHQIQRQYPASAFFFEFILQNN